MAEQPNKRRWYTNNVNMAEQPNKRRWNDSVSDLPVFHGNDKDTITAESIVSRVDTAARTLKWDDEQTYNNFSLAMRSNAEKWLTLQADIRGRDFLKSWQYIKPLFREAYVQENCMETSDAECHGNFRGHSNSMDNFKSNSNRGNTRGHYFNAGNHNSGNHNNDKYQRATNKPAPQKVKCMFCQIIGHHQDDCRKRINAGKPCISAAGKEYFPRNKRHQVGEEQLDQDMGQSQIQSAVKEKSEYLFQ